MVDGSTLLRLKRSASKRKNRELLMAADKSVSTRLAKALKYLELARTSRELTYDSIPFVVAAEYMIQEAQSRNSSDKVQG